MFRWTIKYTVIILCELATFIIYKQKLLLKGQCIVIDLINARSVTINPTVSQAGFMGFKQDLGA
jgi:hypothetical protein